MEVVMMPIPRAHAAQPRPISARAFPSAQLFLDRWVHENARHPIIAGGASDDTGVVFAPPAGADGARAILQHGDGGDFLPFLSA